MICVFAVFAVRHGARPGLHAACASPRLPAHAAQMVLPEKLPFEEEELQALAGVWRVSMDLDEGLKELSCQLTASGRVRTTDESIEAHHGGGDGGRWWAESTKSATRAWGTSIYLTIRLGDWTLLATGERSGLRCCKLVGHVLEGQDDPCCVGTFAMALALPEVSDGPTLDALDARFKQRLDARPAPPARFSRDAFAGRWRMLIDLDGATPKTYGVTLTGDGSFRTDSAAGEPARG